MNTQSGRNHTAGKVIKLLHLVLSTYTTQNVPDRLKLPAVVLVGIEVGRDDHAVAELAARQRLLSLLAVQYRIELHKHLKKKLSAKRTYYSHQTGNKTVY